MAGAQTQVTLDQLAVGSRLLVRSRTDWRFASIAKIADQLVVLSVCSPKGGTYRLRRGLDTTIVIDGKLFILPYECEDSWRDNFGRYDARW